MKFYKLFIVLSLFVIMACGSIEDQPEKDDVLKVVTTIPPLYSLTENLVQDTDVEVINLLPLNTSVHTFQLTPESAKNLNEADLIVINGLDLEIFLEDQIDLMGEKIVNTSVGVDLISFVEEEHEEHEEEYGHTHGVFDPHIWLSPQNAKIQAENIMLALVKIDPDNAGLYQRNFDELKNELDQLDAELIARFDDLEVKPYIVFHDAYGYFEDHFGVESVAHVEEFPGKEPSAAYLADLIDLVEEHDVEVVFTEPQFSPKLVETLSKDYGLKVLELDPLGQSLDIDGYFSLLRGNYEAFELANS